MSDNKSIFNPNEPIPPALKKELLNRGKDSIGLWYSSKVVWAHIMSFASTCKDVYGYYGTIQSNGNDIYTNNFERPTPNIKSIKVSKLGELGTTRKVTVELQAWTDEQLNDLAKCYFIPGMSVRVQFGWNINANGERSLGPQTTLRTDSEANNRLIEWSAAHPHHDGMQGKITNYQYSLNPDGGWDITLEITSAANLIAETKIESSDNPCVCRDQSAGEEGENPPINNNNLTTALLHLLADDSKIKSRLSTLGLPSETNFCTIEYNTKARNPFGQEETGLGAMWSNMVDDDVEESFISIRAFHALLNAHSILEVFGQIRTEGVLLSVPNPTLSFYAISSDPRICYVPGILNSPDTIESISSGNPPSARAVTGDIILDNIMVNVPYILGCLEQLVKQEQDKKGVSLQTILTTIHTTINSKLGNLWDLEIVDASNVYKSDTPILQVVDTRSAKYVAANEIQIEPMNSYNPKNSIIRDFKLETKLTESMKSMALYAYVPNQSGTDPCRDQFKAFTNPKNITNLALPTKKTPDPKTAKVEKPPCDLDIPGKVKCQPETDTPITKFVKAIESLKEYAKDTTVTSVESARATLLAQYSKSNAPSCNVMLPFEFSVTLDGIGGIKFGQYITHPRIPQDIRNNWLFQVTAVEHDISENDWKTTINTIARYRT